jgi:hypothetical protein
MSSENKIGATMGFIEAKVEAAMASRMWHRPVYIVQSLKDKDAYGFVLDTAPAQFVTYYIEGAEKGEGINVNASKYTHKDPKPAKFAYSTDDEGIVTKTRISPIERSAVPRVSKPKSVQPAELAVVEFESITGAAMSADSCIAVIKSKKWLVSVKGSWAIQQSIMDKVEHGLILVIRGQGYYTYPKSMWSEFDSIFKSGTYLGGKPYSQSVLPKKFDKYFTKFK